MTIISGSIAKYGFKNTKSRIRDFFLKKVNCCSLHHPKSLFLACVVVRFTKILPEKTASFRSHPDECGEGGGGGGVFPYLN